MARPKKNTEENGSSDEVSIFQDLVSNSGGELLSEIGRSKYFINTGNLSLNYISSGKFLDGGFPTGITEVYGPPATAKSLLGYILLGRCQKMGGIAVLLDCERAANRDFAVEAGHVDAEKLIVFSPVSIEEVGKKVLDITKKIREKLKNKEVPILFVWDSIGVTPSEREWKETTLSENANAAEIKRVVGGKEQPGERAKACGSLLRKLNPFLNNNNASMMIINQTRDSIGYMSGEVTAGGGKALPFYANLRMRTKIEKKIEDKERDISIGINLTFQNKKNRHFPPYWKSENIPLYFDKGIDPLGGLLKTLISSSRIVESSGKGNYLVCEPWANGQDVKFKASKENNKVPLDVFEKCPQLLDCESFDEIKTFLIDFADVLELEDKENIVTSEYNGEEDDGTDDYDKLVDEEYILTNDESGD